MKIKRILFYVISVLVCFLLQTSVFEFLKLADVMPNILLILTVTIAFIRGKKAGIVQLFLPRNTGEKVIKQRLKRFLPMMFAVYLGFLYF